MFYLDKDPVEIDMDKVESGDSLALSEVHQSTDKLDRNEDNNRSSTIKQNFTKYFSPLLLSYHPPEPQNPTILEEFRNINILATCYLFNHKM